MDGVVNKTVLENGIKVLTCKIPYVRSVSLGIWVNAGARDEQDDEAGMSHFIEHMFFKGTTSRSAYDLAKEFDAMGSHTNAFTTMETTCYHARVMDIHLEKMTEILSDIFLNSRFDDDEIDNERPVILQEISMTHDNPEDYIHQMFEKNIWCSHPLGRSVLGTPDTVSGINRDKITDFLNRLYLPERIIITAAGNLEHDHFVSCIANAFESIRKKYVFPQRITPAYSHGMFSQTRDIEQAHICFGNHGISVTDDRRFASSIVNTILGGNMSSRLFQEIRERRGLAYSVYSFSSTYDDAGLLGIYAGVSPDNINQATDLILKELKQIKEQGITEEELKNAVQYTKGSIFLALENSESHMVRLAQNELHFGRYVPIEETISRINSLTRKDIHAFLDDMFDLNSLSISVLGPDMDMSGVKDLAGF